MSQEWVDSKVISKVEARLNKARESHENYQGLLSSIKHQGMGSAEGLTQFACLTIEHCIKCIFEYEQGNPENNINNVPRSHNLYHLSEQLPVDFSPFEDMILYFDGLYTTARYDSLDEDSEILEDAEYWDDRLQHFIGFAVNRTVNRQN